MDKANLKSHHENVLFISCTFIMRVQKHSSLNWELIILIRFTCVGIKSYPGEIAPVRVNKDGG